MQPTWEAKVRLFVDVIDHKTRPLGRVVLMDHYTDEGSMGVPADSRGVITVGAATQRGRSRSAPAPWARRRFSIWPATSPTCGPSAI